MKIKSLNGLRVIIALCIYTAHAHLMLRNFFSVSFFFMLSGFVLYYTWEGRISNINFKISLTWTIKHIIKLYPIHILMFIVSIFVRWEWVSSLPNKELLIKGLLNITLLQSLTRNPYTFNYCSWYISALCILYFITLPLINYIKKTSNSTEMLLAFVLILQYIINYYFLKYEPSLSFIYSHPVYRVTDFVLGMLTAKMFLKYREIDLHIDLVNLLQCISVVVFTLMLIASFSFRETTNYFSILFIFIIFMQSFDKGWLSEILNNRVIQSFASISFEFYMCHELVLFILEKNISSYLNFSDVLMKYRFIYILGLPISILIAKLLNRFVTKKTDKLLIKL